MNSIINNNVFIYRIDYILLQSFQIVIEYSVEILAEYFEEF
jgi:hypothetical protein